MNLKSGRILHHYRLLKPLSNTNHPVWLAYDLTAERDVVLKFIRDKKSADRERVMMVDGDHPNMIRLFHLFTYKRTTVLVLEHQPGQRLQKIWKTLGRATGLVILEQVASALDAIHRKGLWHGDVSHLNILYDPHRKKAFLYDYSFEKKCAVGFQAPEDYENSPQPIGRPTDVYRFGRLIQLLRPDLAPRFQDCFHEEPDRRPAMATVRDRLARANRKSPPRRLWRRLAAVSALFLALVSIWFLYKISHSGDPGLVSLREPDYADVAGRVPMNFRRTESDREVDRTMAPTVYPFIDILQNHP